VNILWQNEPPIADAGNDQEVVEGSIVTLDGSDSSDTDDGIISYQWKQLTGTPVTFSGTEVGLTAFTAPGNSSVVETLTFQLTVTDYGGLKSTDTCSVVVQPIVNEKDTTEPKLIINSPRRLFILTRKQYVTMSGTASDNVGVTEVVWMNSRGESGKASGTKNWTISELALYKGYNIFTITAIDAAGNHISKTQYVYLWKR